MSQVGHSLRGTVNDSRVTLKHYLRQPGLFDPGLIGTNNSLAVNQATPTVVVCKLTSTFS